MECAQCRYLRIQHLGHIQVHVRHSLSAERLAKRTDQPAPAQADYTGMRVGINATPVDIPATLLSFPAPASCRVFGGIGAGIPSWTGAAIMLLRKARVTPWVSFKDWPDDATAARAVTAWLSAMPADVPEVWLTYHHEPEGDLPSGLYRHNWTVFAQTVRAHPNAGRVRLVPIHTWYPARYKVGDRYSPDWTAWTGVWQQWAPTDAKGAYLGDYMGWDCYLPVNAPSYEPPARFFRNPVGAAWQAGVPLAVPELGALRLAADQTGTGRAGWITDCVGYLRSVGAVAVNWWHATGTSGADYRLTDAPSAHAWRAAIAGG